MFEGKCLKAKCLKAKCLKDGSRDGAKCRFRFGLPIVFAGRRSVGGPGYRSVQLVAVANSGAPGSVLADSDLSD